MTFYSFITEVRDEFKSDLNAFLEEKELNSVRVINSLVGIEKKPLTLAIFPTASSGSTFEEQNGSNIVRFTLQFYCNGEATEKGLTQNEEYFSALLEFIQSRTFGESSTLDASILCRMDEGEPINGCIYLISSRISSDSDFGWN